MKVRCSVKLMNVYRPILIYGLSARVGFTTESLHPDFINAVLINSFTNCTSIVQIHSDTYRAIDHMSERGHFNFLYVHFY